MAAKNGHLDVVNALLADKRVNPNPALSDGTTPLIASIIFGHFEIAKVLLSRLDSTHNKFSVVAQQEPLALVSTVLSDQITRDYYLNLIINNKDDMHNILNKNTILFNALSAHREALWSRLKEPDNFNLQPEAHRALLCSILDSQTERNDALQHPLYKLFYTPKRQRSAPTMFGNHVAKSILDDIQAFVDNHVYSQSTVHQPT